MPTQVENRTLTELAEQLVRAKNDACWQMLARSGLIFERCDLASSIFELLSWLMGKTIVFFFEEQVLIFVDKVFVFVDKVLRDHRGR